MFVFLKSLYKYHSGVQKFTRYNFFSNFYHHNRYIYRIDSDERFKETGEFFIWNMRNSNYEQKQFHFVQLTYNIVEFL